MCVLVHRGADSWTPQSRHVVKGELSVTDVEVD